MGILKRSYPFNNIFKTRGDINTKSEEKKYFVEEGTVEFSNNNLLILTSTARDLKELNQNSIEDILNQSRKKIK